jgi:hypothetical protein
VKGIFKILIGAYVFTVLAIRCVYSQNEDKIKSILESSDQKKIEKANIYKDEGDKVIEEANQLYLEIFNIQGDYELDDLTKQKKVKQVEAKAQKKVIEAATYYQKCNEIKFGVYKAYIEKFWSGYKGNESQYIDAKLIEEQSNDYYYQALTSRNSAARMPDNDEKIKKLNNANELEIQAIDKQISALCYYYNINVAETVEKSLAEQSEPVINQPPPVETRQAENENPPVEIHQAETTSSEQVVINKQMIEMYNRYMLAHERPGDTLPTSGFASLSSFDAERILQLWYAYIYGTPFEGEEIKQSAAVDTLMADNIQEVVKSKSITETEPQQKQMFDEKIALVESERQAQMIPADEEVVYKVQIAANRTQLDQRTLQNIYYGQKSVEMIEENGWYKYAVGDFKSYQEADKFRKSCGVKNAFIVSYRKGKQFVPIQAKKDIIPVSAIGNGNMPAGLIFRIQVAAARSPLTKEQLARIYTGPYAIEMIEEEGWYKYQTLGLRLYSDALKILTNVPVKGAFISAYEDGNKINLFEGVVKNRTLERTIKSSGRRGIGETEFHVQIAASKLPIRQEEFSRIYSGTETVSLIFEEGWYKYRIKAGNSYERATQIKATCGVDKAFIVAYRQARKITLYEALQEKD